MLAVSAPWSPTCAAAEARVLSLLLVGFILLALLAPPLLAWRSAAACATSVEATTAAHLRLDIRALRRAAAESSAPGRLPSGAASARLVAATWRCWQLLIASAAHGGGAVAVAAPRTAALLRWTAADSGNDPEAEQFVYAYGAALLAGGAMEAALHLRRRAAKRAAEKATLPTAKAAGYQKAIAAPPKAGKPWLVALQATWHVLFLEGALLPALRAAGGVLDCEYRDTVQPFPYRASAPAAGPCWTGQHAFAAGVAAAVGAVGYSAALHAAAAPPIKLAAAASPGGHRLAGFGVLECIVAFVVALSGAALRHQSAALPGLALSFALLLELMCVFSCFALISNPESDASLLCVQLCGGADA